MKDSHKMDWTKEVKLVKGNENYWLLLDGIIMTGFSELEDLLNWIKNHTEENK